MTYTLSEVSERLASRQCAFAPFATPEEVLEDQQVLANDYLIPHASANGNFLVATPIQFEGAPMEVRGVAPEVGQHSEEILLELGYTWEDISTFKDDAVTN